MNSMKFAVEVLDELSHNWIILVWSSKIETATALASDHVMATAAPKRVRIRDTIANRVVDEWFVVAREAKKGEPGKPFKNALGEPARLFFEWHDVH